MTDQTETDESVTGTEAEHGGDRRQFMRRLLAGSLAAGGAGLVLGAGEAPAQAQIKLPQAGFTTRANPLLKITFDRRRPPSIKDIAAVIAQVTGIAGCTGCGFDGIDLRLVLDEIVDPEPTPWIGEIQGAPTGF